MSRPKLTADYKILEKIGEGAFSDVYRVRDRVLGTYFAAKKLREECENIDDPLLCSEVNLIKQVPSHPNLLTIVDVMHYGNRLTLIMELMDMSLHDYIQTRKRALSESRARRFIFQIVSGLDHLHRHGIFHRDIKPENILIKLARGVEKKELVQLGDFGTICRIDEQTPHASYIATRWYRAPECLLTMGYYGPKMDVWAVGCCFYEMITRQPLFPGGNELHMLDLIHGLLGTPPKSLLQKFKHLNIGKLEFRKHCPEDFRLLLPLLSAYGLDMLKKTLAYHPDQRISAARLMKHVYFDDVTKHKKLSKFSLSFQCLDKGFSQSESVSELGVMKGLKNNPKPSKSLSRDSTWSRDSIASAHTVHYFPTEGQSARNRTLERLWDMNNTVEKRNLWKQIHSQRNRP